MYRLHPEEIHGSIWSCCPQQSWWLLGVAFGQGAGRHTSCAGIRRSELHQTNFGTSRKRHKWLVWLQNWRHPTLHSPNHRSSSSILSQRKDSPRGITNSFVCVETSGQDSLVEGRQVNSKRNQDHLVTLIDGAVDCILRTCTIWTRSVTAYYRLRIIDCITQQFTNTYVFTVSISLPDTK